MITELSQLSILRKKTKKSMMHKSQNRHKPVIQNGMPLIFDSREQKEGQESGGVACISFKKSSDLNLSRISIRETMK